MSGNTYSTVVGAARPARDALAHLRERLDSTDQEWRALTVWQPWAMMLAAADPRFRAKHYKTIETRRWVDYGPNLATARRLVGQRYFIHAARRFDRQAVDVFDDLGIDLRDGMPPGPRRDWLRRLKDARGAIIAVATLAEVRRLRPTAEDVRGQYSAGLTPGVVQAEQWVLERYRPDGRPYGLVNADVVALEEPVPCKGSQGWWRPEPRDVERVLEQVRRAA